MFTSIARNVANYVAEVIVLGFVIALFVAGGIVMKIWKLWSRQK